MSTHQLFAFAIGWPILATLISLGVAVSAARMRAALHDKNEGTRST